MKQYVTHGTGSAQTLSEVQNTNVVVYDTKADAEADLSNLSEGQIVATKDSGDELAQPVDTVASGNMHAVTSNAVSNAIKVTHKTTIKIENFSLNSKDTAIIDISSLGIDAPYVMFVYNRSAINGCVFTGGGLASVLVYNTTDYNVNNAMFEICFIW